MRETNKSRILLVIIVIGTFLCIVAFNFGLKNEAKLTLHLETAMDMYLEGKTNVVDVSSINYFRWDRVYIFGVYNLCGEIVEILDAPFYWFRCKTTSIEYNEGISLFVFMRNGNVVGTATPSNIPVGPEVSRNNYLIENAYFYLNENGNLEIVVDQ